MALAVVSVRPVGAVSCGIHRASFRSGSGALALASMAPLHGLNLQASTIGLTLKVVAAGHRMVAVACAGAAGLQGGNAPLDPTATLPLKNVAERTLSMLRQLHTPEKGYPKGVRLSVAQELGMLRAECEDLVEELAAGRNVSCRAASITLLGIHARVDVLLELLCRRHPTLGLEESTMKRLQTSMAETEFCLEEQGIRAPAAEEVAGAAETALPKLAKTLAKKTIVLLAAVSEFYLSKDVTLPERILVSEELNELRDRCVQLIEEVTMAGGVADHAAAGVLLGLHARFRIVFLFCIRDRPDSLDARISAGLATSLTDTEQRVKHYVQTVQKETSGDAAEEVE